MRILYLLVGLFFAACQTNDAPKGPFAELLQNCNEVGIALYNNGDTLHFDTKDTTGVRILKSLLTGKQQSITNPCPAAGLLTYKANGRPVYTAEFAVSEGKEASCNYIRYQMQSASYTHRLSDRAHNLLKEVHASGTKGGAQQQ